MLSNQGPDEGEIFIGSQKVGMKIPIWALGKIQKGLVWGYSNREKSTIPWACFGDF
jgi:hypothetical protein